MCGAKTMFDIWIFIYGYPYIDIWLYLHLYLYLYIHTHAVGRRRAPKVPFALKPVSNTKGACGAFGAAGASIAVWEASLGKICLKNIFIAATNPAQ